MSPPSVPRSTATVPLAVTTTIVTVTAGCFITISSAPPSPTPASAVGYGVTAFPIAVGLNAMWFWRNARVWETWGLGAALLGAGAAIALLGLERGVWLSLLTRGTLGTLAGLLLEALWINWVRSARHWSAQR